MKRRQSINGSSSSNPSASKSSGNKQQTTPGLSRKDSLKSVSPPSSDSLKSISPELSILQQLSPRHFLKTPLSLTPLPFDLFQKVSFKTLWDDFQSQYTPNTDSKSRIIDIYLLFVVLIGVLTFLYGALTGAVPYHSFLAAFGAALGSFVFAFHLRLRQTCCDNTMDVSMFERAIVHFLACHFVLFICVANFIA